MGVNQCSARDSFENKHEICFLVELLIYHELIANQRGNLCKSVCGRNMYIYHL